MAVPLSLRSLFFAAWERALLMLASPSGPRATAIVVYEVGLGVNTQTALLHLALFNQGFDYLRNLVRLHTLDPYVSSLSGHVLGLSGPAYLFVVERRAPAANESNWLADVVSQNL